MFVYHTHTPGWERMIGTWQKPLPTQHTTNKIRRSMPTAGFEHAIPAIVRLCAYSFDRTANRIGNCKIISTNKASKRITHFITQYTTRRNAFQKGKMLQSTDLIIFPNYEVLKTILISMKLHIWVLMRKAKRKIILEYNSE
jgi:hypothetical protein